MRRKLGGDSLEQLEFFAYPPHLWEQLRTTSVIERCFGAMCRRTRPMLCRVNAHPLDRTIFSISD